MRKLLFHPVKAKPLGTVKTPRLSLFNPVIVPPPRGFSEPSSGQIACDGNYFYVKYKGWRQFPLFNATDLTLYFPLPATDGFYITDNDYFYYTFNHIWKRSAFSVVKPNRPILPPEKTAISLAKSKMTIFPSGTDTYGSRGMISMNKEYFCVYGQGKWRKIPLSRVPY